MLLLSSSPTLTPALLSVAFDFGFAKVSCLIAFRAESLISVVRFVELVVHRYQAGEKNVRYSCRFHIAGPWSVLSCLLVRNGSDGEKDWNLLTDSNMEPTLYTISKCQKHLSNSFPFAPPKTPRELSRTANWST